MPVSGTLSAPGGALAFNATGGFMRFFAKIFGADAVAALPGTSAVVGATVKLIEIDGNGNQVGADIASAITGADGSFTLNAPAGFTAGAQYVIRAVGTNALDRMLTDLTAQDVDPASSATTALVVTQLQAVSGNPRDLQRAQLEQVLDGIVAQSADIDAAGLTTTAALVAALKAEAQSDEEAAYALSNLVAAGSVTGTVTDASGAALANVKVVARDFNQWVRRAETRSNANGQFTLNLSAGDYIVGALNFTAASMAASEWWTCNDSVGGPDCGAANMFSAGRITVGAGAVTANFKLEAGARIEGTIVASGTASPLPGVHVLLRDFLSDQPVIGRRAQLDGSYRVNLRPGTYTVGTRNRTRLPYAGGLYNGAASGGTTTAGGGANASAGTPMVLAAGSTTTANFDLDEGGVVRGNVTDGTNPVGGISVRFYDSTDQFVEAERSSKAGKYRLWVRPGAYTVRTRGQFANPTVVAFSSNNNPGAVNFTTPVGSATAVILDSAGNPMPQVKVRLFETLSGNRDLQSFEISNGDGSVTVYAPTGNYLIEYRVDNGSTTTGSAIHDGSAAPTGKQLAGGLAVAFSNGATASLTTPATVALPTGGELKGTVTLGATPTGNIAVQVRFGGTNGNFRFITTRTQRDGSYTISVPAASYDRVCAFVPGTAAACGATLSSAGLWAGANGVVVNANASNTLDLAIP
ncbi:MAG: carboxypeptidase-like regulatory domain-containing protein [Burkholderiaceae bacterium]